MTYDDFIRQWSEEVAASAPPVPGAVLQPGLGVPAAALDQVAANPAELEMPAVDVAAERARVAQPEIEMPAVDVAAERAKVATPPWAQASQVPEPPIATNEQALEVMQPGLGIPRDSVDQLAEARGQASAEQQALHEQDVDAQIAASFDEDLPLQQPSSRFEDVADARAKMSNVEAAQDDALQAQIASERAAQQRLELERRATEEADAALKARLEARQQARAEREQINAEAKAAAEQKIGARDWYEEGGIGRTVGAMVIAAVGGLVQHLNGGRNLGLEAVDRTIDRWIATKQADRAHKRSLLNDRMQSLDQQMAQDAADAREDDVMRRAAYERALRQVEVEQQNYDPEGTRARSMDNVRRELIAKMQASELAAEQARAKLLEEQAKVRREEQRLRLDQEKAIEDRRKNRADERLRGWEIGSENKRASDRLAFDEKKLAADVTMDQREAEKDARKEAKEAQVEARELGGLGDVTVKRDPNTGAPIVGADGKPVVEYGSLRNADGGEWRAPTKELNTELSKKRAAAANVVDMLDEVLAIRDRVGGESETFNSDDSQRLKVLESQILSMTKQGTQGMSSDADMNVLKEAVGAKDVTSFRSKAAGLEKGRERVLANLNNDFKIIGKYTGKPINIENRFTAAPKNTAEEERLKELYSKPQIAVDEATAQVARLMKKRYEGLDLNDPAVAAQWKKEFLAAKAKAESDYKDITPQQEADLQRLGDIASGTGPDAEKARRDLQDAAKSGQTAKIREAALAAIRSADAAGMER